MSTNVPESTPEKKPIDQGAVLGASPVNQVSHGTSAPLPPTVSTEGLPEYEPLTPELVEEEAIRGDFVLKWAVILLAVLLASTLIADTPTLVHVKTGQYLASHGLLPPARDVLSASATDHRWVNLSWFYDLLLAGVYGVGKFAGLSAWKAILAGIAFGFVAHINRPGASTWWGSICVALAVLVCQPRFTAQPEVVTLLGIGLCLWFLHQGIWTTNRKYFWAFVPVCAVWSNLDERAWWGPYLLTLYGGGEFLGALVGRVSVADPKLRKTLWTAIGCSWLGLLVNPFLWSSWLAPITQFGTIYPILSKIYSGRNFLYLDSFRLFEIQGFSAATSVGLLREPIVFGVGYLLILIGAVTLVMNRRRVPFGHVLMFFGALVPMMFAVHELAAVAIVLAVLATLNGQAWFAANYSRTYSIDVLPLLFSRGGRAVTVLGLFVLALLFTFGRLQQTGVRNPGWGIDSELDGVIRSFETAMQGVPGNSFNFTPEQGDILIWLGHKPFMDHRVGVYSGSGPNDLILGHVALRNALAPRNEKEEIARPTPEQLKLWTSEFDRLEITHALPRLTSNPTESAINLGPDNRTFFHLGSQRQWQLTRLSAATAVFCRTDSSQAELKAFIAENRFDFGDSAFKTEAELLTPRDTWPQLPTFYQRYVWKQDQRIPSETREARHRLELARTVGDRGVGMIYQAIRRAQESVAKNTNDSNSYQLLGEAYAGLIAIESPGNLNSPIGHMRYLQAIQALNLAIVANPDNLPARLLLVQLYRLQQRTDLELRELQAVVDFINRQPTSTVDDEIKRIQDLELFTQQIDGVRKRIDQVEQQAAKIPKESKENKTQMAGFYAQGGMFLKALDLLKPEDTEVSQPLPELMFRATLLLESGQAEAADELTAQLEAMAQQMEFSDWQQLRVTSLLAGAKYSEAAQLLINEVSRIERQSLRVFVEGFLLRSNEGGQPAPLNSFRRFMNYEEEAPGATAVLNLEAGLIYLEAGQIKKASECFTKSLAQAPHQQNRPLLAYYLFKMAGKWIDPLDPNDRLPNDIFPKEK